MLVAATVSGGIYALISVGFALAFRVSRAFNLAHGGVMLLAAYSHFLLSVRLDLSLWLAAPLAITGGASLAYLIEAKLIPIAKRRSLRSLDLLVVSWFVLIVIQNCLRLVFSSESIYVGPDRWHRFSVAGVQITTIQIAILVCVSAIGLLLVVLSKTVLGKEITAVGDNARLARIVGLDVQRILSLNGWAVGFLTASAGVLLSYQERIDPDAGFRFSIVAIVATLIGLRLGPIGSVLGAFSLALAEASVLYYADPGLRDAAVFGLLILVILVFYRKNGPAADALTGNSGGY